MRRLIVIGNGMAGARLLEELVRRDGDFALRVFGAERHGGYNRIGLPDVLAGTREANDLTLNPLYWYAANGVTFDPGVPAVAIDPALQTVTAGDGTIHAYDELVIATGSRTAFPAVEGLELPGVFGLRSLDDCQAMLEWMPRARRVAVVGGGLLGLEAGRALLDRGLDVEIVHRGARLLGAQLDAGAGAVLRDAVEDLGMRVRLGASTVRVLGDARVEGLELGDGTRLACDMVVFATGTRPHVELAAQAGLPVERGIVVDDTLRVRGHEAIHAIGECAQHRGVVHGLVAPAWEQAAVVADRLTGDRAATYRGSDHVTKLKVRGIELAVLGIAEPRDEQDEVIRYTARRRRVYKSAIVRDGRLAGAILIGDLDRVPALTHALASGTPLPEDPASLFFALRTATPEPAQADLGPDTPICHCNNVSKGEIEAAAAAGCETPAAIAAATRAGTGCGSCRDRILEVLSRVPAAA